MLTSTKKKTSDALKCVLPNIDDSECMKILFLIELPSWNKGTSAPILLLLK